MKAAFFRVVRLVTLCCECFVHSVVVHHLGERFPDECISQHFLNWVEFGVVPSRELIPSPVCVCVFSKEI